MDFLTKLSQSLLTPVIAIVAVYIAWQQWKTNELKLRLERYDRRMRVYQELVKILSLVIREAAVARDDLFKFRFVTAEADFLFGSEISDYIEEIFRHGFELHQANRQYRDCTQPTPPGYDHQKVVQPMDIHSRWFLDQPPVAKQKFKKYLDISG